MNRLEAYWYVRKVEEGGFGTQWLSYWAKRTIWRMGCGYKMKHVCPASIRARSKMLLIINPSITATS